MLLEYVKVLSESWPFAVAFMAMCAVVVVRMIIRRFENADRRNQAYRASNARDVSRME